MTTEGDSSIQLETPSGSAVRQLSVFLVNRVGSLMSLVKLLREHAIEVVGLSVQDSTELTLVRLILSDPETASTLFIEKGIPHAVVNVVVIELVGEEHDLNHCLAVLLAAEVNIHFLYPLITRPGRYPLLTIQCDDGDVCAGALHTAGFHVLMQEELSR
jgi:hypothetical protein